MTFDRVCVIVLDSVGVGAMPDFAAYDDPPGTNSLGNTARALGGLKLPNLGALGLGNILSLEGVPAAGSPKALYGRAALAAPNKDTTSGHWEMMGCVLDVRLRTFPNGFPQDILDAFMKEAKVDGVLANKVASGTEVIAEFGDEHVKTKFPIVYTSADSVFQIAAHEEAFGLQRLYQVCEAARKILRGPWEIGRVIARPFLGTTGAYKRTSNRHDYSLEPPRPTVLELLEKKGIPVTGVGKIKDIFADKGVPESHKTSSNAEGIAKTIELLKNGRKEGLLFVNLVDFDMLFGHRRDPAGYGRSLEEFDAALPGIMSAMNEKDLLVISADHGNDPTASGTDHTREYCPVLAWHKGLSAGKSIGDRKTLADIGATVAGNFGVPCEAGEAFL